MKLIIELYQYNSFVFGRVVEQEGIERACGEIIQKPFMISSSDTPELEDGLLWIRGTNKKADKIVFSYNFDSPSDASNACKNILIAVAKINGEETETQEGEIKKWA